MEIVGGAVAELLNASLIVERVRAGMRRAKLEGRRHTSDGKPWSLDRSAILRDRQQGQSLGQPRLAKGATWSLVPHYPSRARLIDQSPLLLQKGWKNPPPKPHRIKGRIHPIRLFHNLWVKDIARAALLTSLAR